jgi:hypothetical protein
MVVIQDPQFNVIFKRSDEIQGIILFNTTTAGEYRFIFANTKSADDITVTLALHTYEDNKEEATEYDFLESGDRVVRGSVANDGQQTPNPYEEQLSEIAGDEEISIVRNHLRTIQTNCKNVQTETKLSFMRQEDHNQDMQQNGDWFFKAMLLEVLCFLGVLAYQLHHLKVSLDNKLVL